MSFLPNPWIIVGVLIVWIGTALGAGLYGSHVQKTADTAKQQAVVIQAQKDAIAKQSARDKISLDAAVKEAQVQKQIVTVTQTIEKKVPIYVTKIDRDCHLSNGVVRLWNEAIASTDTLPQTPGESDGTASKFSAADALNNLVTNAAIAHQNAARLTGLQQWVTQQENVK